MLMLDLKPAHPFVDIAFSMLGNTQVDCKLTYTSVQTKPNSNISSINGGITNRHRLATGSSHSSDGLQCGGFPTSVLLTKLGISGIFVYLYTVSPMLFWRQQHVAIRRTNSSCCRNRSGNIHGLPCVISGCRLPRTRSRSTMYCLRLVQQPEYRSAGSAGVATLLSAFPAGVFLVLFPALVAPSA